MSLIDKMDTKDKIASAASIGKIEVFVGGNEFGVSIVDGFSHSGCTKGATTGRGKSFEQAVDDMFSRITSADLIQVGFTGSCRYWKWTGGGWLNCPVES